MESKCTPDNAGNINSLRASKKFSSSVRKKFPQSGFKLIHVGHVALHLCVTDTNHRAIVFVT